MRCAMNVLLPQRPLREAMESETPKYRTLYLLHGYSDDHTAWQRWTSIERYAEPYQSGGGDASGAFEFLYRYGARRSLLAVHQP